ncbi:GDP-mannose 4,6-dehydratase [Candidatus Fonsibacter ubiquis]|uniref:GDP-mannose 4,6-dehydratase n=1 Tax=Candidatus Fonsibacter ubiquis TaxID=1925548 RepID=UPI000C06F79A|nr:GDP-mannose 4,6-dehydratase [Candidatus Fonsibacter ubiquis]
MKKKTALIFGVTGQDGSYISKLLISKGYRVEGVSRGANVGNLKKLKIFNKIKINIIKKNNKNELIKVLKKNFNEIYFFAGNSSITESYINLEDSIDSHFEPIKIILNFINKQKTKKTKLLFAGSSEIFGHCKGKIRENSLQNPNNPYGLSKSLTFSLIKFYRERFNLPVCTAIFFNHESSLRKEKYVIKKIITNFKKIQNNKIKYFYLGNINIKRDWGWAPEYVFGCYKMLQIKKLEDLIIATGKTTSLKEIINYLFKKYKLNWKKYIKISSKNFRRNEIIESYADISRLKKILKWKPVFDYKKILDLMYKNHL